MDTGQCVVKDVQCRSLLNKSKISDYTVNCYTGCQNRCVYCYARFMKRFTNHEEEWGTFVDVKVNAVEVLAREVGKRAPGTVIVSSVCDGWQEIERERGLTRQCVKLLLEHGFQVGILTKCALVERDFDVFAGRRNVSLGMTLTAADDDVARLLEPGASLTSERVGVLRRAGEAGIPLHAFLGPFIPGLTDTNANIAALLEMIADLPLDHFHVDALNLHRGIWPVIKEALERGAPNAVEPTQKVLFDRELRPAYLRDLSRRVRKLVDRFGLAGKGRIIF